MSSSVCITNAQITFKFHKGIRLVAYPTILIFGLVFKAIPAIATSPSFSCEKASTPVEHIICNSYELSGLDRDLANAYAKAASLSDQPDMVSLKYQERSWLSSRGPSCAGLANLPLNATVTCLGTNYKKRIAELNDFIAAREPPPTSTAPSTRASTSNGSASDQHPSLEQPKTAYELRQQERQEEADRLAIIDKQNADLQAESDASRRLMSEQQERSNAAEAARQQANKVAIERRDRMEELEAARANEAENTRQAEIAKKQLADSEVLINQFGDIGPGKDFLESEFRMPPDVHGGPVIQFFARLRGRKSWSLDQGAWVLTDYVRAPGSETTQKHTFVFEGEKSDIRLNHYYLDNDERSVLETRAVVINVMSGPVSQ